MGLSIGYVGKHDSGGADDEGAITHALTVLGHNVQRLRESRGRIAHRLECDFLLFHHWHDLAALAAVKAPKVCWCFDLIDWPNDPTLAKRCQQRRDWIARVTKLADVVFMTDGDWVAKDRTGKLVWLTQGADERVVGLCVPQEVVPILFTGIGKGGGRERESFVREMQERYGDRFRHVSRGVYGRELADLIASAQIVVAPDSPVTGLYWSNRVYGVLGFGGFLLHPYSSGLGWQYRKGLDVVLYHDRENLRQLIDHYLKRPKERAAIAGNGLLETRRSNLYRHRCERLVQVVRERIGAK